jgi:hypothetical protein
MSTEYTEEQKLQFRKLVEEQELFDKQFREQQEELNRQTREMRTSVFEGLRAKQQLVTPEVEEITKILNANPLLAPVVLKFVRQKIEQIQGAISGVLNS